MVNPNGAPAHILSFGAGVNTVALMVMLVRDEAPLDGVVFADTGGETPDTYRSVDVAREYLDGCQIPFAVVKAPKSDLYSRAMRRRVIPSVQWRWCTRDFKVNPIHRYYRNLERHVNQYIGIAFDEVHRMRDSRVPFVTNLYPLIDERLTRQDCIDIIAEEGLPIPEKSGCYFCPFNSTDRWRSILEHHPALFDKAIELEENSKHFPRQRLTDQVFRERTQVTLREYRNSLELRSDSDHIPEGMECGGECMT